MKVCRSISFRLAVAIYAATGIGVNATSAAPFSQFVVLGDSLSDIGNMADATFDLFPGDYYFGDRFSNGPVFVEALSTGWLSAHRWAARRAGITSPTAGRKHRAPAANGAFHSRHRRAGRPVSRDSQLSIRPHCSSSSPAQTTWSAGRPTSMFPSTVWPKTLAGSSPPECGTFSCRTCRCWDTRRDSTATPTTLATYNSRTQQFNTALAAMLDNLETPILPR